MTISKMINKRTASIHKEDIMNLSRLAINLCAIVMLGLGPFLFAQATPAYADDEIMTERCSGDVYVAPVYESDFGRGYVGMGGGILLVRNTADINDPQTLVPFAFRVSEDAIVVRTPGEDYTPWQAMDYPNKQASKKGYIRWFCHSEAWFPFLDPGTWTSTGVVVTANCNDNNVTPECNPGAAPLGVRQVSQDGWYAERSRCSHPEHRFSVRLGPDRLLQFSCRG